MNGNITNLSSLTHQEIHKIFKDEIIPLINQIDTRVQNFENKFVKEAAEFVRDFTSLAKEAGDSLDKIKALEFENSRLLKAVQCLIDANHVICGHNFVNEVNYRAKKQKENVLNVTNQTKLKLKVMKPNKVGSKERLASPKPSKPRTCLRWSPTGRIFNFKGKIIASGRPNLFMVRRLGGNILIAKVNFVKGLRHNLFSVGQFCDSDLKVTFKRNTYFIKNLDGVDLLKGSRTTNLYTINLYEMASASPICIIAHATSTKSWLWHQRLSFLNFSTINDLAKNDLVTILPKLKYHKGHLCPTYEQGKSTKASHPPKPIPNSKQRLHLLYRNLCDPMRVESINRNRYVLVIVDDYCRYTRVSSVKTPQQNGVVEHRSRTLVEAARTMSIFLCASLFLWAKAIATACYSQNRSIIHCRFNKTPYKLINGRKPCISFLHVFKALCYPKNDREDLRKLGAKGLDLTYAPSTITSQKPTELDLDLLFETMYDDYIGSQPTAPIKTSLAAQAHQVLHTPTATTTTANTAPTLTNSSSQAADIKNSSHVIDELEQQPQHDSKHDHKKQDSSCYERVSPRGRNRLQIILCFEDVYMYQPEGFIDADHPSHIYKLKKALYGLKQAQKDWCDELSKFLLQNYFFKGTIDPTLFIRLFDDNILMSNYVLEILKKYGMETCDPIGTPMEIKDKLDLDKNGTLVDVTKYHSMIGSLMYLSSSRPNIVHATCLCARYQAKPTEKHLKEVKRIFHYLWGTVNMGL
nr:retrovirus-related Pol polyprotein from transposon TNT 1-94 [Tanacetum cinerariifolium]